MSNFGIVTTFHQEGFDKYGKTMMESLSEHVPKNISLTAYYENMPPPNIDRWDTIDFNKACGEKYNAFKKLAEPYEHKVLVEGIDPRPGRGQITPGSRYLFEAARFSHKYYAVEHFWNNNNCRYVIWCDADVLADKDIPYSFFTDKLVKENIYWSRIGRDKAINIKYPECGFMVWDTFSKHHVRFKQLMSWMYDEGACFKMHEWHDSYLWWSAERYIEGETGEKISLDLGDGSGKDPFVRGMLGEYFDHMKGDRKDLGYSPERIV